jgi:hypothetical protein
MVFNVEHVLHAQELRGPGHELHQPARPLGRHGARLEVRFDANHRLHQLGRDRVPLRRLTDQAAESVGGARRLTESALPAAARR